MLRLEDRESDEGLRSELRSVYAHLNLDPSFADSIEADQLNAHANGAKAERPPMRADTAAVLRAFFTPHNARLADLLRDDKFTWRDVKAGAGTGVSGKDVEEHRTADRAPRRVV